jgi:hypothetical protein
VCELATAAYLTARQHGIPLIAISVFPARNFYHATLVRTSNSVSADPRELEGKRVGVRAYTDTGVSGRAGSSPQSTVSTLTRSNGSSQTKNTSERSSFPAMWR